MKRDRDEHLKSFMENSIDRHFSVSSPMQSSLAQQEKLATQIRQALYHINEQYVQIEPTWADARRRRQPNYICTLSLRTPDERWSPKKVTDVVIELDPTRLIHTPSSDELSTILTNLQIVYHDDEIVKQISSLAEIVAFAEACERHSQEQHAEVEREAKLRELKRQATLAHMKKLAKEDRFTFSLVDEYDRLDLYIRFNYSNMLKLDLPYDKYPDYLELLGPSIRLLSKIYDKEMDFSQSIRENSSPVDEYMWDMSAWDDIDIESIE